MKKVTQKLTVILLVISLMMLYASIVFTQSACFEVIQIYGTCTQEFLTHDSSNDIDGVEFIEGCAQLKNTFRKELYALTRKFQPIVLEWEVIVKKCQKESYTPYYLDYEKATTCMKRELHVYILAYGE